MEEREKRDRELEREERGDIAREGVEKKGKKVGNDTRGLGKVRERFGRNEREGEE